MKIKFEQFLNGRHSWGIVGQNLARSLIGKGNEVHLYSTNGIDNFPDDLRPYLRGVIKEKEPRNYKTDPAYDMQISYTAPLNFGKYLANGSKNRFGIWCYEWPILPQGMAKHHVFTDKILAPSEFAKYCFVNSKVPEEKVMVLPHGINLKDYEDKKVYALKTKKTIKILINIGQSHIRKNLAGTLKAFGEAFTKKDDVCLVAKIHFEKAQHSFDVDAKKILLEFRKQYPNHAEIEFITEYIPNIIHLYNACDIVYTLSYCEGYYMPGLEALGCNKLNIAPRYGGQLDFLNDRNSLLVDGRMIRASRQMQYWTANVMNSCFESDIQDASAKLRLAVYEYDSLINKFENNIKETANKYTWENATNKLLEMVV